MKPSYTTYVRVFHEFGWKDVIHFRSDAKHSKCNDCEKLKQYQRCAFSKSDADLVLKKYHFHLSVTSGKHRSKQAVRDHAQARTEDDLHQQ